MTITGSRTTIKVLGIPIITISREEFSLPNPTDLPDVSATADEGSADLGDVEFDELAAYLDTEPSVAAQMSEHGYAYSCSRCDELLVEGLSAPITGPDEIELAMRHLCTGVARG